jgi:surface protein
MINGCSSLISLDISNFNTQHITTDSCHIFTGSSKLIYLNLKNAILNNYFIEQINADLSLKGISLTEMNSNLKSRLGSWNLIISCINNLNDISNSNYKIDCYIKSFNAINKCSFCGVDYYKIYIDIANTNSYYKCHKSLDGYYIDYTDLFYKPCYYSCQKCNISGNVTNHNCIECAKDYKYELDDIYFINCYNICSYYFYYDISKNKSYCTTKLECPANYSFLIPAKNECIYNCLNDSIYKYQYGKKCFDKCPKYTLEKELYICDDIKTADEFILYMKRFFINEVNLSYLEDGNDIEEKRENVFVTISTNNNQKLDIANDNKTILDLGLCEDELKYFYNK